MSSRYYLGVDGGQSSTVALIANEAGQILGRGKSGPCNHASAAEGRTKFLSAMSGCLQEAFQQAGLDGTDIQFASVCLGFSGGAEDKDRYARELIRSARYKITHDAEIALAGAVPDEAGIIAIAGTGSMVFGRNAQGETARAGGWGYIYGDEGGAFDLTRRALRAALAYEEGWGPATNLHRMLLGASGAENANQLLHRFYGGVPRPAIASYAPVVTGAALGGDPVAQTIVQEAAAGLSRYVRGAYSRLFPARDSIPVCPIGAVFRSEPMLRCFREQIADSIGCPVVPPHFPPVVGALLEALRADGNNRMPSRLPEAEK